MRYFLHLGYDGSKYRGWQRQANVKSVQGTLENRLTRIFKTKITVYGCGRTDAGVHAAQYVAHINLAQQLNFDLKFRLNKNLPDDIVIYDVIRMRNDQHSRYDVNTRTYDYFVHFKPNPGLNKYSSLYPLSQEKLEQLDFNAMKQAVNLITTGNKEKNFRHFCKQPNLHNHTLCIIEFTQLWVSSEQGRMHFTITANRFLRGMMRIMVASLIKIGLGELSVSEFKKMLHNQGKPTKKKPALPSGLFLSEVSYPYLTLKNQDHLCSLLKMDHELA